MTIVRLDWDSEFFGFPVARISGDTRCEAIPEILQSAKLQGVRLVYWSASESQAETFTPCGLAQFRVVDQITLRKSLSMDGHLPSVELQGFQIEQCTKLEDGRYLLDLALQAGSFSRFRLDSRIAPNLFTSLYKMWIDRSCGGEIADAVFRISDSSGVAGGMITLSLKGPCCSIGLIAVSPGYRRRGLGRALIQLGEQFAHANKCIEMSVVTQAQNREAIRLYEAAGFLSSECLAWYHFWLDEADCARPVL
jgi:dTDP-4-amino-4,6-dideoxy-D-galactose acyltransferase